MINFFRLKTISCNLIFLLKNHKKIYQEAKFKRESSFQKQQIKNFLMQMKKYFFTSGKTN